MTHQSTRNPMSETRRQQVYGPLRGQDWQDGDRAWLGLILCAVSAAISISALVWISAYIWDKFL